MKRTGAVFFSWEAKGVVVIGNEATPKVSTDTMPGCFAPWEKPKYFEGNDYYIGR